MTDLRGCGYSNITVNYHDRSAGCPQFEYRILVNSHGYYAKMATIRGMLLRVCVAAAEFQVTDLSLMLSTWFF